jgi:hypothetical protein
MRQAPAWTSAPQAAHERCNVRYVGSHLEAQSERADCDLDGIYTPNRIDIGHRDLDRPNVSDAVLRTVITVQGARPPSKRARLHPDADQLRRFGATAQPFFATILGIVAFGTCPTSKAYIVREHKDVVGQTVTINEKTRAYH